MRLLSNVLKPMHKRLTRTAIAAAALALAVPLASESTQTGHAQPLDSQYNNQQGAEQAKRELGAKMHQSAQFEGWNGGFGCDGSNWLSKYYIDSKNQIWVVSPGGYVNTYSYSYAGRLNNETRTGRGEVTLFRIEEGGSGTGPTYTYGHGRQLLIQYTRGSEGIISRSIKGCRI